MEVIIAPKARADIANILVWTEENFGPRILKRYAKLIATAIEQIAQDPERAGTNQRPEIAEHCRSYHLYFSRTAAGRAGDRIRQPRHFLLYRVTESSILEIGRVLHESMDLQAHLPDEYRRSPG
jgi:toxin ParE1/3/4